MQDLGYDETDDDSGDNFVFDLWKEWWKKQDVESFAVLDTHRFEFSETLEVIQSVGIG